MSKLVCDAIIVQVVATEVDEMGRPVGEHFSPAVKWFRAKTKDPWSEADALVSELDKQRRAAPVADLVKKVGKRR